MVVVLYGSEAVGMVSMRFAYLTEMSIWLGVVLKGSSCMHSVYFVSEESMGRWA